MYIEFLIKRSKLKIIETMRDSRLASSLLFMLLSGVVMWGLQKSGIKKFWFAKARQVSKTDGDQFKKSTCVHSDSCRVHIWREMKSSLTFGLVLGTFKTLISTFSIIFGNPVTVVRTLIQKFDYGVFMFVLSYKTIFEVSTHT